MKRKQIDIDKESELRKNPINDFICDVCKDAKQMSFEEFKHHLFTVHNIKHDQLKGRKQMVMHMDGDYWFSSTYKWTLETGLQFTQFCENARDEDDPMRMEH